MKKHLGKRERVARKNRCKKRGGFAMQDHTGMVTFKLGRKKFSEAGFCGLRGNRTASLLKKKFRGCVVEAER